MDIVGISCKAGRVYVPCAYAHKQPHNNRYMVMPVFNPSTQEEKEEEEDLL